MILREKRLLAALENVLLTGWKPRYYRNDSAFAFGRHREGEGPQPTDLKCLLNFKGGTEDANLCTIPEPIA